MSIFDKFPFLEGLSENEYDSAFREHVPDLETLLTYDVFVEFTHVDFPKTMPYVRSLQYELYRAKCRGSSGDTMIPCASFAKRMTERFPLDKTKMQELRRSVIEFYSGYINEEDMFCFETEFAPDSKVKSMREFICYHCQTHIHYDSDESEDYDYYNDEYNYWYNEYDVEICNADDLSYKNNDDFSGYFKFLGRYYTNYTLMCLMKAIDEDKENQPNLSLRNALIALMFFPYMKYDTTVLLETIYKSMPNLAILIVLYPEFKFFEFRNVERKRNRMAVWYDMFFVMPHNYMHLFKRSVIERMDKDELPKELKYYPEYLELDSSDEYKVTHLLKSYNIVIDNLKDNQCLENAVPDLETLLMKVKPHILDYFLENLFCADYAIVKLEMRAYIRKNVPHLIYLMVEYWKSTWTNRSRSKCKPLQKGVLYFMRNYACPKDYDWNAYKNKVSLTQLVNTLHNGTLQKTHTRVTVDISTHKLPVSDDYQLLASTVEAMLEQDWCSDLPTETLFSFMPFAHTKETRLRIIDMIREKDIYLAYLLMMFHDLDPYVLANLLNNHDISCYWTLITTDREQLEKLDISF